jgi:anti-anti-sigma regulatory factor
VLALAPPLHTWLAMLRVHKEADEKGRTVLRLEGSLLAPWIPELVRVLETVPPDALVIDLASLAYVDKQGERLLRDLTARAELRACSPLLAELLRRSQDP